LVTPLLQPFIDACELLGHPVEVLWSAPFAPRWFLNSCWFLWSCYCWFSLHTSLAPPFSHRSFNSSVLCDLVVTTVTLISWKALNFMQKNAEILNLILF
jgi:hypothetical protein